MSQDIQSDELTRLKQRVEANPISVSDILALAEAYAGLERWQEAIETYEMAISLDASKGDIFNDLGTVYEEVERLEDAEKAYQQAIELDPKLSVAYVNLGHMYEDQHRLPEAIQVYKKYLQHVDDVKELSIVKHQLFKEVTRLKIRKIDSWSLAKILGVMYTAIGFIVAVIFTTISLFFSFRYGFLISFSLFGFANFIFFPLGYGIMGLISGLVVAAVYNFVASRWGGIELEAE